MLRKYKGFIAAFVVYFVVELIIESLANGLSFDTVLSSFLRSISFSVLFWAVIWFLSLKRQKYYNIGFEDGYELGRLHQSIVDQTYNSKAYDHHGHDAGSIIDVQDFKVE